jgi:hypothetical protein
LQLLPFEGVIAKCACGAAPGLFCLQQPLFLAGISQQAIRRGIRVYVIPLCLLIMVGTHSLAILVISCMADSPLLVPGTVIFFQAYNMINAIVFFFNAFCPASKVSLDPYLDDIFRCLLYIRFVIIIRINPGLKDELPIISPVFLFLFFSSPCPGHIFSGSFIFLIPASYVWLKLAREKQGRCRPCFQGSQYEHWPQHDYVG